MNLIPSSIAISNFLSLVCRLISCDDQQRYPSPVTVDTRGSRDYFANELDLESSHNLVDSVNNRHVPEVNTNAGRVRGYYMTIIRGKQIIAFEGIKYAESPSGRLRFKVMRYLNSACLLDLSNLNCSNYVGSSSKSTLVANDHRKQSWTSVPAAPLWKTVWGRRLPGCERVH